MILTADMVCFLKLRMLLCAGFSGPTGETGATGFTGTTGFTGKVTN